MLSGQVLEHTPNKETDPVVGWPVGGIKFRILASVLLALFGAYWITFVLLTIGRSAAQPNDFFALWGAAKLVSAHPAAQVYDPATLRAYLLSLGMDGGSDYPFPYPPFFLLALQPLSLLPYVPAYVIALGATLALYVWATAGRRWSWAQTGAAVLAPASTVTLVAGQTGFLAAALLIGGFRLLERRPAIAGILFGLATYKPQLGLLVPVALIAVGAWRCIGAAIGTIVALAAAATAAYGPGVWPAWVDSLDGYAAEFASARGKVGHLMPTVFEAAVSLGAPVAIGYAAQAIAAAAAAGVVWMCFRCRGGGSLGAAAALFVATFLAVPHAFVYDMPVVTTAVLWMLAERAGSGGTLTTSEVIIGTIVLISPVLLVAGAAGPPVAVLALALLLTALARRCCRPREAASPAAVPAPAGCRAAGSP